MPDGDTLMNLIRTELKAGDEDVVTTFPIFEDGMRGIVFAVVPGDGTAKEKMARFLTELLAEYKE